MKSLEHHLRGRRLLFLTLLSFAVLWLIHPQEVGHSDEWHYAKLAFGVLTRGDFGPVDPWGQRLAVVLPTAACYGVLGVSVLTTNLLPLVCALVVIATVWLALAGQRTAQWIGMALCVSSGNLIYGATHLFPDLVAGAAAGVAFLLFTWRTDVRERSMWHLAVCGALAAAFLFLAFLAKLTCAWAVCAMAYLALWRERDWRCPRLLTGFYLPALVFSLSAMTAYFLACDAIWGDPFSRAGAVEGYGDKHRWILEGGKLAQRLTIEPLGFLLTQFGALILALLKFRPRGPWATYLVISIACFWAAPVSLSGAYSPLPVHTRIVGPMIPSAIVVGALMAASWSARGGGGGRAIARAVMFVLLISSPQAVKRWGAAVQGRPEEPSAISAFQGVLGRDEGLETVLLTADPLSPQTLGIYFDLDYPPFLRVMYWEDEALPLDADQYFFHINSARMRSLKKYRGMQSPTFPLQGPPIFAGLDVRIMELDKAEVIDLVTRRRAAGDHR